MKTKEEIAELAKKIVSSGMADKVLHRYDGKSERTQQMNRNERLPGESIAQWKRRIAKKSVSRKPLFDREKVLNRVAGDAHTFDDSNGGVTTSVLQYLFNDDDFVNNRIKTAELGAEKYKNVLTSGDYNLIYKTFRDLPEDEQKIFDAGRMEIPIKQHEDAKRIYLGFPPKYGTMEPSKYRPTIGNSEKPYQVNPLLTDGEFNNLILPLYTQWKTGVGPEGPIMSGYMKMGYKHAPRVEGVGNVALARNLPYISDATISEGFDKNGQYISLYDVWDYNTNVLNTPGDNIGKWIGGKPFDIYQRYYLDDWLDVPEGERGNPYIAPSYIEADYTGPGAEQENKKSVELNPDMLVGSMGLAFKSGGLLRRFDTGGAVPISPAGQYSPLPLYPFALPDYSVIGPAAVPVIDARKDAARRIRAVENSKKNPNGGWNEKEQRWYPHSSYEGGADTIAYGIKLSNGSPEAKLALKQGYLTDEQANSAVDTLVDKYYNAAQNVYDKKYGAGEWDKLSDWSQSILTDYSYNPGLAKFPSLMEGFHSGDMDKILANYKRYSGGKPLGRNKILLSEIQQLNDVYPIFRADGGKIHIKPSHRGKLTELKKRTGKSEAELYNDGNPAHKKMVVFARNARKWNHHADGGILERISSAYNGDTAAMLDAIQRIKEKRNG